MPCVEEVSYIQLEICKSGFLNDTPFANDVKKFTTKHSSIYMNVT